MQLSYMANIKVAKLILKDKPDFAVLLTHHETDAPLRIPLSVSSVSWLKL